MKLEELIGRFTENAGLEKVSAVEGVWKFSADGNVFGVTTDETGERVWLFGEIPLPGPDRKGALLKAALEANYFHRGTGGATFSLNPVTGALTLFISKGLDGLDEERFFSLIEMFVNALATWNALAGSAGVSQSSPPEDNPAPLHPSGLMRV